VNFGLGVYVYRRQYNTALSFINQTVKYQGQENPTDKRNLKIVGGPHIVSAIEAT